MGSAPYTGPRLGDGPIFKVSVSRLDTKECPGKLSTDVHNINSSRSYLLTSTLLEHGYQSRARVAGCQADTSPCAIDGSRTKWAWLQSLATHNRYFVLKHGIRLTRLVLRLFGGLLIDLIPRLFEG